MTPPLLPGELSPIPSARFRAQALKLGDLVPVLVLPLKLAVCPWTNILISLCLHLFLCKTESGVVWLKLCLSVVDDRGCGYYLQLWAFMAPYSTGDLTNPPLMEHGVILGF